MNVNKNGKIFNKVGFLTNTLLRKIVNVHSMFSTNTKGFDNNASYPLDENTRGSVRTAYLQAERWRAEVSRSRLKMC